MFQVEVGSAPVGFGMEFRLDDEQVALEGGSAVQVLGGMGFTWDMLPNHLLKRSWVLEQSFDTADAHAYDIGAQLVGRAP